MNEGNITVVDVIATDDGYQLSRPAQDLYIAYEVVRRHIDSDGVRHYAQMSSAKITDDGYEFKFETGDVFTCASHEDRPASATVSDAIAGGSSDEPLINEVEETVYTGVLGEYENVIMAIYACKLNDDWTAVMSTLTESELDSAVVYVDGVAADEYHLLAGGGHVGGTLETDAGKPVEIKVTKTKTSSALINLYDPDSEDTSTYYPDGAFDNDAGVFVLDVSAAYERLKHGQNVWVRSYVEGSLRTELVYSYYEVDGVLTMETYDVALNCTNYTGESESDGE